jgi:hypothetical protein
MYCLKYNINTYLCFITCNLLFFGVEIVSCHVRCENLSLFHAEDATDTLRALREYFPWRSLRELFSLRLLSSLPSHPTWRKPNCY